MSDPSSRILESVPQVSTADPRVVRELAATLARPPEVRLIHVGSDAELGRTAFTVLGEEAPLLDALVALARRCNELLDLRTHEGAHPRVGSLDAVPLIALPPAGRRAEARQAADRLVERLVNEAGRRCVRWDSDDEAGEDLSELRRGGLARLLRRIEAGDVDSAAPEDETEDDRLRRGVTCVGARAPLVELEIGLLTDELRVARRVAERLQESTGGLPGVRAWPLKRKDGHVQLLCSLVDLERTGIAEAWRKARDLAADEGVAPGASRILGCLPRAAWTEGLGELLGGTALPAEERERRLIESWLPGGERADDEGLLPDALPRGQGEGEGAPADQAEAPTEPRLRLLDLPIGEARARLEAVITGLGERGYRTDQVLNAVWKNRRRHFEEMSDLPKALRASLEERVQVGLLEIAERQEASDGTVKYLWRCPDGGEVESVSIPSPRRTTFCLSSQVGCSLKCRFCATGYLGFGRNLSAGEILDQVLGMLADLSLSSESLNVVFMGMGEPGHNLAAVLQAVEWLNDPAGLEIGARRITVSTSGVPGAIAKLAEFPVQLRLALSLHAADQEIRESLMNIAEKHSLDELLEACRAYQAVTRRNVTLEYCVIPGVTDGPENARKLAAWAARLPSKINLIPYNPVEEFQTEPATRETCQRFRSAVLGAGYRGDVTVRETRGRDIEAACGMLHRHRGAASEAGRA